MKKRKKNSFQFSFLFGREEEEKLDGEREK